MSSSLDGDGTIFADQYEYVRMLGEGRYGYVAEVFDHRLKRNVALKIFTTSEPSRVWEEAQALERVRGKYILEVHHAGLHLGKPFVVTEVAENGTVDDHIVPQVGLPPTTAVAWARQMCRGVARMHDDGLVHRDIKPGNLFLTDRRDVLVGDLGNARLLNEDGFAPPGGTETTMSLEVAKALDSPSRPPLVYGVTCDIYSLGATLYWMVAGRPPRPATNPGEVCSATVPDVWDVAPHLPRGLRDVINLAVSDDPAVRFASAMALDGALGNASRKHWTWERMTPHPDHTQCFHRRSHGSAPIIVCAIPTGPRRVEVQVRYEATGRRLRRAESSTSQSQLPRTLRATFRAVES